MAEQGTEWRRQDRRQLMEYGALSQSECPFCRPRDRIVLENELAAMIRDNYPVTEGHLLIIPKRHTEDWFSLTDPEREAINELLLKARDWLAEHHNPDGFNIGMNCGEAAGQTVFHMHCHLIPRYRGDSDDPRGGVRGVRPGKQQYG